MEQNESRKNDFTEYDDITEEGLTNQYFYQKKKQKGCCLKQEKEESRVIYIV